MSTFTKTFDDTGAGPSMPVKHGESFHYDISGTFAAILSVQQSRDGQSWDDVISTEDDPISGDIVIENAANGRSFVRVFCSEYTSGDPATTINSLPSKDAKVRVMCPRPNADTDYTYAFGTTTGHAALLPQSKTAKVASFPIIGLEVGEVIVGFFILGQVESAGGDVTVDADLVKTSVAAADPTVATVASITQLATDADLAINRSNGGLNGINEVVAEDASYSVAVTVTTDASTDAQLLGIGVITEKRQ